MKSKSRVALAIAALSLVGTQVYAAADAVDDAALTGKVKAALLTDSTAKGTQIDVESKDGIVQLNGFVDSTENKVAAARVASGIEGVKGVDNNLDVRTTDRSVSAVVDDAARRGRGGRGRSGGAGAGPHPRPLTTRPSHPGTQRKESPASGRRSDPSCI